ncbi:pyrimidine reductase family protein [Actinoplanes sp. TRM 88003]|uniref:Pyrimidine reductase family protein n=1 Tax=Paractinoplanes aksuensis TaxID=2939490 RepID=A0ABT1DM45_9ACTN|nr:pyrimidine reductase family protein [Actinoplanes aksuensis]MCO8270836.1 pyrimidine reductase family protein [Actinoplanes aksuensis]
MTSFPAWPSSADGLIELYPRNPSPTLRVNFIASADGAVTVDGLSAGLQGPGDKQIFDSLRMVCDALIVASGTVRAENYDALRPSPDARQWRIAHGLPEYPLMVIVSGSLNLDLDQLVFTDAPVRPIVVTTTRADPAPLAGVADVIAVGEDRVDCAAAVRELNARGATQLLSEGGPQLFGALIEADVVDELCLTVAPLLVGGGPGRISAGAPATPRQMSLRHVLTLEEMLFLRFLRQGR